MKDFIYLDVDLRLFENTVINKTTSNEQGNDLSPEMKTFYSDYLIDLADPELVHDQFAQKHPIPKNGGKTIEFRKYDPLPKALTPISEGVTPTGNKLNVSTLTATVNQYGDFIELTDVLLLTAIDNNLVEATKLLGSQAGRTLDTVTREVLNGGTNVLYAHGKTMRGALVGGDATAANNDYLKVDDIKKAVRALKVQNTPKYNGSYVGIIHPDCEYDLMNDPEWKYPHQYVDTDNIYSNEIGQIAGVRFVDTSEAKIFAEGAPFAEGLEYLTVASYASKVITVSDDISATVATAIVGKHILLADGEEAEITAATAKAGATAATITIKDTPSTNPAENDKIYPAGGGKAGRDVYSTLVMGANAYGVTEIAGGGLQHIVKQLGSSGTADPLNQRATAGWKAIKTAERLVEQYMVRIESTSTFNDIGAN